jgi:hypothetical protein
MPASVIEQAGQDAAKTIGSRRTPIVMNSRTVQLSVLRP